MSHEKPSENIRKFENIKYNKHVGLLFLQGQRSVPVFTVSNSENNIISINQTFFRN